jgi:nitrite reductase/ring-hydroxylating ferredoxin subunit
MWRTGVLGSVTLNDPFDSTICEEPAVMTTDKLTRRTLGGLAAAGVGLPLLAACAKDPDSAADPVGTSPSTSTPSTPAASTGGTTPGEGTGSSAAGGAADALAQTTDIDVGGGQIFADQEVVVTQPKAGEFKCFTAVCSHQGCIVSSVSDGTINCDCHGSQYSIDDGSVVQGPATFPLAEEKITVAGKDISLDS